MPQLEKKHVGPPSALDEALAHSSVKNPPTKPETQVQCLGQEAPLEKEMATYSSILAGKSHGQRSLVGYSPWVTKIDKMRMRILITANKAPEARKHVAHLGGSRDCSILPHPGCDFLISHPLALSPTGKMSSIPGNLLSTSYFLLPASLSIRDKEDCDRNTCECVVQRPSQQSSILTPP